MSAAPARAPRTFVPSAPRPTPAWRPRLSVVPSPRPARSLVPYLLLCAAILSAALLGALLLNTHMAAAAYEIHDQQVALSRLDEAEASLRAQVEEAGAPATLQRRAAELGMVPAQGLRFIRLADGALLGAGEAG
ncbi:hypothetical protein [Georgenia yuyongxinii]|uniref:Cell division protein FtsL n=1 Tax=Georgenia yuyongxinii TaxID=2589797 RepID=A0A552WRJ7_9MICO|nr:hypothetical protein [Georgenia yuyongxinii]TRW45063.1 hypothetical protein FJ693_11185 [Georgenia yuyongxinii]